MYLILLQQNLLQLSFFEYFRHQIYKYNYEFEIYY